MCQELFKNFSDFSSPIEVVISNFDLSGCFYVHFFPSAERNEPKKRRLRGRGSTRSKGCAFLTLLRHPLPLKYPPLLRQSLSVSEEISRINTYMNKIRFNFNVFKLNVVCRVGRYIRGERLREIRGVRFLIVRLDMILSTFPSYAAFLWLLSFAVEGK